MGLRGTEVMVPPLWDTWDAHAYTEFHKQDEDAQSCWQMKTLKDDLGLNADDERK